MANVDGLHNVGKKVWDVIQAARDGVQFKDAVEVQELFMACIAVKDDLDTKPELVASALNIEAGFADAIADMLRGSATPV